jgi:hypothetical protein
VGTDGFAFGDSAVIFGLSTMLGLASRASTGGLGRATDCGTLLVAVRSSVPLSAVALSMGRANGCVTEGVELAATG